MKTTSATDITARLKTTPVFAWNYHSKARVKNNQGGTSSGKTIAILQVIFMRLAEDKLICDVIAESIPNLKSGALLDFQERVLGENPWMNEYIASYNITERKYTFINGSQLKFRSFKDEKSARSGKRDIAFFNEANSISYAIYKQVALRTSKEIFIDYNPSEEFWVHDHVINERECVTFYSNFRHNPYIDENVRKYILTLRTLDQETWKVYGLGKTGQILERAITKIEIIDEMPKGLRESGYGMDFGYSAHPSTLIQCGVKNERDVFFDEVFFDYHMKTSEIDERMKSQRVRRNWPIYADPSHEEKIDDLSAMRWTIHKATKGPGSIKYGIDLLNDYNLHVTARSVNMINEQKRYKKKIDPLTGRVTNEFIDAFNHTWDSARYWAVEHLRPISPRSGVIPS